MASADSVFDDLSDADIDSFIDDTIPKNTEKATAWGTFVLKGKVAIFKFFIQASWSVFACCLSLEKDVMLIKSLQKVILNFF